MIKFIKSGFFTSIQDQGRRGYRNQGVPTSGAMDSEAYTMLNKLLENEEDTAVFEITMVGVEVAFTISTAICVTGAEFKLTLNDTTISNYQIYPVKKGDILKFGKLQQGFRAYLGVKGGLFTEKELGSRSQFYPITANANVLSGESFEIEAFPDFSPKISRIRPSNYLKEKVLEVFPGPDFHLFDPAYLEQYLNKSLTVAKENNRMGYQIEERFGKHQVQIITSGTLPGTVQMTPSGGLMILMRDGQTTGGYPRAFQLSEHSINILSQKKYKDEIVLRMTQYP